MKLDGSRLPALLDDLEAAVREFRTIFENDASGWSRGPSGKWTAGQHADHVAVVLALVAGNFEVAADQLRQGTIGPRPWRDPLQALAVWVLTREPFPRGGKAPDFAAPGPTPSRDQVFARMAEGAARHRAVAEPLSPEQCDRLWIWNPFAPKLRWHYTLPEMVRVHATHTRHHLRLAKAAAES